MDEEGLGDLTSVLSLSVGAMESSHSRKSVGKKLTSGLLSEDPASEARVLRGRAGDLGSLVP